MREEKREEKRKERRENGPSNQCKTYSFTRKLY